MRTATTVPVRLGSIDRGVLEAVLAPRRTSVAVAVVGRADAAPHSLTSSLQAALADVSGVRFEVTEALVEAPFRGAAVTVARLLEDGVRVVVADLPHDAVRRLAPLCAQYGAALVAVGTQPDPDLPGVLHIGRDHHAARTLGAWAAQYLDGDLFQVVAAPDAEFEAVEALRAGYQAAGGSVAGLVTTHDGATGSGAAEAARQVRLSGARTVAVHASAERAAEILRALRAAGADVDVVLDGPGSDDRGLTALGDRCGAVYAATTGAAGSTGGDVARLLAEGSALLAADSRPWSHLADALAAASCVPDRSVAVRRSFHGRLSVVARRR